MQHHRLLAVLTALVMAILLLPTEGTATADSTSDTTICGDLDRNGAINISDTFQLTRHLINEDALADWLLPLADANGDGTVNGLDLSFMRGVLLKQRRPRTMQAGTNTDGALMPAPIRDLAPSLPSTGTIRFPVFSIEFQDISFQTPQTDAQLTQTIFGPADTTSADYPNESITGFFERSSYGNAHVTGDVYTYKMSGRAEDYTRNQQVFIVDVLRAFEDTVDFRTYDADHDNVLDYAMFLVPPDAPAEYWGMGTVKYPNVSFFVDGLTVGMITLSNVNPAQYYVGQLIREVGRVMGLPSLCKKNSADFRGFHGDSGYTRMDSCVGDFCGFSKLMLGWLRKDEVQIAKQGTATYSLRCAQKAGSCIVIPRDTSNSSFFSEYFLIEYISASENNKNVWYGIPGGIRVFHIQARIGFQHDLGTTFAYGNYGAEYTNDDGIRIARLVNDGGGFFQSGSVIDASTRDFAWYDLATGTQTVDPGVSIRIGALKNGAYDVTVSVQ